MVDEGDRVEEVLEAVESNTVTRDVLNETMASLRTSVMAEVKSMLKELLEGLKSTPDPLLVVNPTASASEANSGKEAAMGTQTSSPHGKNGTGTYASVPPPPVYGGPVPYQVSFESQLNKSLENHRARLLPT